MAVEESAPVERRNWISLILVLVVQAQNAFNDNFVKFTLLGLGAIVAKDMELFGNNLGENIKFILSLLIPLPFILGAPLAGWFSDRYSKRNVMIASLVLQLVLFLFILAAIFAQSVWLAIIGYFFLAVQSTIFSPAKQGILKEIVGSKRLGFANGLMMMLTMVGILAGIGIGGKWFDFLLNRENELHGASIANAWVAAKIPMVVIGVGCLVPLLLAFKIQKTPAHPSHRFSRGVWLEHFSDLKRMFSQIGLGILALRISFYWLIANSLGLIFLGFGEEMFPDPVKGGANSATSDMMLSLGIGLILGSSVVSFLSRKSPMPKLIPLGAFGMLMAMVFIGLLEPGSGVFKFSISVLGFFSGFFLAPLSALFQDAVEEKERGSMIAASNLMNSLAGLIAILLCYVQNAIGLSAGLQMLILAGGLAAISFSTISYLRQRAWAKS